MSKLKFIIPCLILLLVVVFTSFNPGTSVPGTSSGELLQEYYPHNAEGQPNTDPNEPTHEAYEYEPEDVQAADSEVFDYDDYEEYVEYPVEYTEEPEFISPFADMLHTHGYLSERFIEHLNDYLPNRVSFSYRELETAQWIVEQLKAMGYEAESVEIQEFSLEAGHLSTRVQSPLRSFYTGSAILRDYSQNVILHLPGRSNQKIIVGAHYDSFYYPGASDNASGVGLLLESAMRMRYRDNYFTLVYVFFGAEEVGLIGAYYYLYNLSDEERDNIVLMISADCLFDGAYMVYAAAYDANGRYGTNTMTESIDQIARRLNTEHNTALTGSPRGVNVVSDHLPFLVDGHTVMVLFSADIIEGGRFRMRVFHSDRDDIHYINNRWPGRIQASLRSFSMLLEEVLLQD